MELCDVFSTALASVQSVAPNHYLALLAPHVEQIEREAENDPTLQEFCRRLTTLAQIHDFALSPQLTNEFAQLFGEAHFFALCRSRSVALERVAEDLGKKTPDFRSRESPGMSFEVKTLSPVDGHYRIKADIEDALSASISVESQLSAGSRLALAVSEVRPYSNRAPWGSQNLGIISTLIEKVRQNIKIGQYPDREGLLVLNFCLIPPATTDVHALRPAYCDDYMFPKAITGDLWMLAFAQPGMLVLGCPEFEGQPCVQGINEKRGVLADSDFEAIKGILGVVYPLNDRSRIFGLFRSVDYARWMGEKDKIGDIINKLVGESWNDELDTNGWRLSEKVG